MDQPFVAVAATDAIPPGKFIKVVIEDRPYLVANVDGHFYAVEDRCSHEDYPLSYGCLDGDRIKCSLHGSRFSLATGAPLDEPADEPIRTYRLAVDEGRVWLDPSSPAEIG
ncbi:Rieske (2Fe-2S) protein [Thiocystis violascens]|uniref:Ferredoxin subunit of nitrite reductase and ring-hydroxylating dioxygenase n=1 Tax=Thiocystis violascens (strain ATCC 17096 / DSM 198 / 6111) TaxID=765911 RepID=I3Y7B5_THIV6|nr:non-heme iron oxygenase ferredoxin subunit [Thiocystis violascens]AFL72883.1 ferredoxin subunit of nitrite reductase and ring-hydroxylating dioxygenase [Thiocystis violascens DSM 198]